MFIKPGEQVTEGLNALDYLDSAKKTFTERNAIYGDSYKEIGPILEAMFPNGIQIHDAAEHNRFCLFLHCLDKLRRYAARMGEGGHKDSALDLCVYAAMLRELTEE